MKAQGKQVNKMNTTIIKKDFWTSDEFIELHLDTKIVYMYLLAGPQKNYLNVFKFNKHPATQSTGVSAASIQAGLEQLQKLGYIEMFQDYIGLLKGHAIGVGGQYGAVNTARELSSLPVDVREHFALDGELIVEEESAKKPVKKPGPPPETIKTIITRQHPKLQEALKDFVADRIERKKSPTTRAVKGWINKLNSMYPNDHDKQAQSLYQSIERGWMGLFEVKQEEKDRAFM